MVLSIVLWLLTTMNQIQKDMVAIPLEITGIPAHMISMQPLPSSLSLQIQSTGYRLLIRHLLNRWKKNALQIDLSKELSASNRTLLTIPLRQKIQELNKQIGEEYQILSISPDTLVFHFDIKATRRVKVHVPLQLEFAKGYAISGKVSTIPDSILLTGNQHTLEKTDSIFTQVITMRNVSEDIRKKVPFMLPDGVSSQLTLADVMIPISRMVQRQFTCYIQVRNNPDEQIQLVRHQIEITARIPENKFQTLSSSDFTFIVDAKEASEHVPLLIIKNDKIPDGCTILDIQPAAVEYLIKMP